jgi:hypothetical protein
MRTGYRESIQPGSARLVSGEASPEGNPMGVALKATFL